MAHQSHTSSTSAIQAEIYRSTKLSNWWFFRSILITISYQTPKAHCRLGDWNVHPHSESRRGTHELAHPPHIYDLCQNPDKRFYWDETHPTHAGWEAVMEALEQPLMEFLDQDYVPWCLVFLAEAWLFDSFGAVSFRLALYTVCVFRGELQRYYFRHV